MKVSALVPAKDFTDAKRRLAPLLGAREREALAEAMLSDVLGQVGRARGLEALFVVTGSERVAALASSLGAGVIREEREAGETAAVVFALRWMMGQGVEGALIVPGDIPLVRSGDIELLVADASRHEGGAPFALLTPSHDRVGTNALLLFPPDAIGLRFGHDSFSYHLGQVAAKGIRPKVVENERIALDIDEPGDLERFIAASAAGETYRLAFRLGFAGAREGSGRCGRL